MAVSLMPIAIKIDPNGLQQKFIYLRRFSTAFRIAKIKNTHRWLLLKC